MRIEKLNAAGLKEFISSESYNNLENLPITRHRAISYLNNPRIHPEMPILYLAFGRENALVGYRLILSDQIYIHDEPMLIGWFSTVWVAPSERGKGIAKELVNRALDDWKGKICLQNPAMEAKELSMQTNWFSDKYTLDGLRCYMKFNLEKLLPPKHSLLKKIGFLLNVSDHTLNFFNNFKFYFAPKINSRIEYITVIDEETGDFIKNREKSIFKRGTEELNWIIKNPWVIQAPLKDEQARRYHFSSVAKSFSVLNIKIYNGENTMIAFLMLSIRNGHLKIPYSFFDQKDVDQVVDVIYHHMLVLRLDMLTVFDQEICANIKSRNNLYIFTKKIKRQYLISKEIMKKMPSVEDIVIQEGDGDAVFT